MPQDRSARALAYHRRTRHAPHAYARALGYLDWDSQPDPFRRYVGAPPVLLDRAPPGPGPRYDDVLEGRLPSPAPLDWTSISSLFFHALALSAWKQAGAARWSLRVDPSSGNLHPTEGYLVCGPVPDVTDAPAVFHYQPLLHALERRAALPPETWAALTAGLPAGTVFVGLTSIVWREAWKYGERAFRYCQHDLGHALAATTLAAAGLGWRARLLDPGGDDALAALLGVADQEGPERELPEALLALSPADAPLPEADWRGWRLPAIPPLARSGVPAPLSRDHHDWPAIDDVAEATRAEGDLPGWAVPPPRPPVEGARPAALFPIVRQRRSAVAMDPETWLGRAPFLRTLRRTLPGAPPFDTLPWTPAVALAVFVHRVRDLAPGLYLLARAPGSEATLRAAMHARFRWEPVDPSLPLWLLEPGDFRAAARDASCGQDIAADSVYALGMIADLGGTLRRVGAPAYRRLHWEAGAVGQVLYLEAETDGVRGTGIGCFFDDETHRLLGLRPDGDLAALYHFTVGGPVEDPRLRTEPAYAEPGGT